MKQNALVYLVLAALVVGAFWLGFGGSNVSNPTHAEEDKAVAIGYNSMVCKEVIRADGTKENLGCKHNLFTNFGKNISRDLLSGNNGSTGLASARVIALGNSTGADQAATNVSLGQEYGANPPAACGLGRAAGTYSEVSTSHGNWSISKVFTASCDSLTVSATGLYNSTSGNTLFAETTFTSATLQSNDQINITWYVWVT